MKTYKEIFTYDNLYNGYLKCRRSKRYKTEVIEFELEVGKNLKTLEHKLLTKTYLIDEYKKFMIYDPKKREIQALDFSDRIIQRTFCDNYFMPFLEKHLIYDNGACMKGKGTDFSRKRLRVFLNKYYKEITIEQQIKIVKDVVNKKGYLELKEEIQKEEESYQKTILIEKLKEEKIVRMRYGLLDGKRYTLEEVGLEFDVTRERIRQIEKKAIIKLRRRSLENKLKEITKK